MSALFEAAPGVVWRPLDEGLVLLDTRRGQYYELNASGRALFELLCAGQDLEQAIATLKERFSPAPARLPADMRTLTETLLGQQLLRARGEG